ncbi:TadE/TadG family type IV pilus assembly protein [Streptomyces xiamenensis]|uniref:TadE/TadG family type IV pilus assembly protein n=1 Tax=Streptomyces xiamenensis TaxID=408015 RepID=UPI0035DB33A4
MIAGPRGDRGVFTLELAILAPLLFLLLFGTIQAGLYFHAREVAHRAAQRGVEVGRSMDVGPEDGAAAARDFLQRMGGSVNSPSVSVDSTAEEIRIEVTGSVSTLIPGLQWGVSAGASGPIERITP